MTAGEAGAASSTVQVRAGAGRVPGRWLREPVLHFLGIGAALFGLYAWLGDRGAGAGGGGEIVVTRGRIASIAETFGLAWGRPPSEDELAGLVREFVREEVLVREALALGLDRDDTVVRRRLAQKMEFLTEDLAGLVEPRDEDLHAYLAAHPDAFRIDPRFTFSQVFLDRGRRGLALAADAAALLARLEAEGSAPDPASLGDSLLLEARQEDVSRRDVEAQFGAAFAARLEALPLGLWQGPIASGYGAHLVRVEARIPGRLPPLGDVRDAVVREWSATKRRELEEARFQALLARYRVAIEEPPAAARGSAGPAEVAR
jgi:hypothetical protein